MRFPEWARKDGALRLKFLCLMMSAHAHPEGTMYQLARKAGINYNTALKAQAAGQMSYALATSLAEAAGGSGVKAIWLISPAALVLSDDGEVVD